MSKNLIFVLLGVFLFAISCTKESNEPTPVKGQLKSGNYSGTFCGATYYTYPDKPLTATTGHVFCYSYDVPNRFNIYDNGGSLIATSGWMGYANYGGPWGRSISTSGSITLNFSVEAGKTYVLRVETAPNGSQCDAWAASYY